MKSIYSLFALSLFSVASLAQAPTQLLDINAGSGNSFPSNLIVFNNRLLFSADDSGGTNTGGADLGKEPWSTDGTIANTSLIRDINVGSGNSSLFNEFIFNGALYFSANDGAAELWTTDFTAAGTVKVDLFPSITGEVPNNAKPFGNVLYLTTNLPSGNNQLTEWDGTNPAQIAPNVDGAAVITSVSEIVVYNNLLYLYMETSVEEPAFGRELYSYNPATDTYTRMTDISSGNGNAGISGFTVANGLLYFEAEGNLWQSDGTTAGTIEVPQNAILGMNGVDNLFNFNNNILFEGDLGNRDQLFILNTTTGAITQLSSNTGSATADDFNPSDYAQVGNFVYFSASPTGDSSKFLYRTDGTGIKQMDNTIKDIDDLAVLNGLIYMEGDDNSTGNELFVFDPATASIQAVSLNSIKMYPNPSNGGVINFTGDVSPQTAYRISDLSGRSVLEGKLQNKSLNHDLKTGIYFVALENIDVTFKLIIE